MNKKLEKKLRKELKEYDQRFKEFNELYSPKKIEEKLEELEMGEDDVRLLKEIYTNNFYNTIKDRIEREKAYKIVRNNLE